MAQVFVNGDVYTGPVHHRILTGVDAGTKKTTWQIGPDHISWIPQVGSLTQKDLDYGAPDMYPEFDRTLSLEARAVKGSGVIKQQYTGIYFQDELGFYEDKLRLYVSGPLYFRYTIGLWRRK